MLNFIFELWYLWLLIIIVFIYGLFKSKIKGVIGEKAISVRLTRLDPAKYKVINDLMLTTAGKTSQIDHIVVSNYGIFVIETKNYKGWIIGDEYAEYWTQVIYKRKEKLYNPLRQNYGHIQALKDNLQEYGDLNYIPIIVFSTSADLKVKSTADVIYSVKLLKTIRKYSQETITDEQKEAVYSKLMSLNIGEREARNEHVKEIKTAKAERSNQIEADICPKCKGKLVDRKGKYGTFKGCSNYPKCKFTAK